MKEKRISLRFREDNERDMRAWDLLERMALKKNASKNSVALELLLLGAETDKEASEDALAEHIADIVAEKLMGKLATVPVDREAREAAGINDDGVHAEVAASQADEPVLLGEDALDFLDAF